MSYHLLPARTTHPKISNNLPQTAAATGASYLKSQDVGVFLM